MHCTEIYADNINEFHISIFDIVGKKVSEKQIKKQEPLVSVNNLAQGIYIMRVDLNGESSSFKIVKNR